MELAKRAHEPWLRRVLVTLFAVVVLAAMIGAFGQQHETVHARVAAASLTVKSPPTLRGGLLFQGRLDVTAHERISRPRIVLGEGWTEEMQLNTLEPAPAAATSSAGRLELEYDALRGGDHLTIWMQFAINPTNVGRRDRSVTLLDGDRYLTRAPGTVTVLP